MLPVRALRVWIGVLLFTIATALGAQTLQPLPTITSRVTDTTGTLSSSQIAQLESQLRALEEKKGSQIAIVIVPSTEPEAIEQYAIRLGEKVKIGRKKVDDGVIIVVAKNDQKTRIEVGYGLEGAIPDVLANRVRREAMNPLFRQGQMFEGLLAGTAALTKLIEGEQLPAPAIKDNPSFRPPGEDWVSFLVVGLVLVVMFGGILTSIFGRFFGSTVVGGIAGGAAWVVTSAMFAGVAAGVLAFIFSLVLAGTIRGGGSGRGGGGSGWTGGWGGGGWSSGSGGGWSSGGGTWSGGGGSFGGGGAGGSWSD